MQGLYWVLTTNKIQAKKVAAVQCMAQESMGGVAVIDSHESNPTTFG